MLIQNEDLKTAKVISIATGTKCVNGEHMSLNGTVLNDSHAEIVTRRCLMDFFYNQLLLHTNDGSFLFSFSFSIILLNLAKNLITFMCLGWNRFLFAATAHESIFERPCFPNDLYKVRDGIKFHLYINTAPCGDARIFCPHDNNTSADKYPMR